MTKLIAQLEVKPGQEELVAGELAKLVAPSRAEEGCIAYTAFQCKDPVSRFLVVEQWASQEALDEHLETPHFKAFVAAAGEAFAGPPLMQFVDEL